MHSSRDYIPLAPIQEHFWTAGEHGPTDGFLTECVALRLRGRLDRPALAHAVRAVLARHEILRTTFVDHHGEPVMRVRPAPSAPPLSWAGGTAAAKDGGSVAEPLAQTIDLVRDFAEEGTDPGSGPPIRFLVVSLGADDHVFALAVHHLVADATAVRTVLSEISDDYLAFLRDAPSPVPQPTLQYGDFAIWERDTLLPAALRTDAPFWRENLRDAPAALDLRLDRPRPPVKGTKGRRRAFSFPAAVASALAGFAREQRTTPYAVCLAAFAALVTRSTGDDDLVLGVLAANRPVPQAERLVGQFSNTVPLRIRVAGDPAFAELTARCTRAVAEAVDHARLPLSRIVEVAGAKRDPRRTTVVQHLFLPLVDPVGDMAFCGLATSTLEVPRERGRFDTVFEVGTSRDGLRVWVEYDTRLYTEHGIDALVEDYARVLTAWLGTPGLPVSALPLTGPPAGEGPSAHLAEALGLSDADTLLIHPEAAHADAVRGAALRAGAHVVPAGPGDAPDLPATAALVPAELFGAYVGRSTARTLVTDACVAAEDLARWTAGGTRRVLRLLQPYGGLLLVADCTGVPGAWPVLRGGAPVDLQVGGVPGSGTALSPYAPGTLYADSAATPLTARWNPLGRLEILDGVSFVRPSTRPGTTGRAEDGATTAGDPLVSLMCELWAQVLERPLVHADDDFIELGGYSMVAMRLIAELDETLGVRVRVRTLFENPTPALLAAELRRLHPRLDALLALVASASASGDGTDEAAPVPAAAPPPGEDTPIPLLAAQRQLWLAEQANPGALTHTIPLLLRIDGPLDASALRAAVACVVARQAGLRGTFVEVDGEPVQRVAGHRDFDVPLVDLGGLPWPERDRRARALEQETAYGGFDITRGPLLRARLVRLAEDRHVLHLLFHHLVTDEVSMTVFMREMSEFYRARTESRPASLAPLTLGFADLVRAEQDMLAGAEGERLRRFWRRKLANAPRPALPTDRARPDRATFTGEFLERRAPREVAGMLGGLARERRTTPFAVFCSAVVALLHHLTGQDDLVVGVPAENRGRRGAELLIGCFLNVLPVRVDCSGDPSFAELLDRVRTELLLAYEHQALPFAEIVDAVRPERLPGTHPVYQVTCELQLADWMPADLPGCRTSYELISHGTARYDMSFHSLVREDGVSVMLEINTDLWDRETGLARIDQVLALLVRAAKCPDAPLSALIR
ncbi:condensation domain-containing protein [Streptomyces tremellae]|uniref:Carrier domain-containing protein n=1 Tax=Streptomyces tremellae TaxID=1124239 RepID=A0ABP7ESR4_9ACTN